MGFFRRLSRSADLVSGMSERLGLNVADAMQQDPETSAVAYRRAVWRCANCIHQDQCQSLQGCETTLGSPPSYCKNKEQFMHLARV